MLEFRIRNHLSMETNTTTESINVQATCNAKEEYTSIDAQWPGSVHDSRILKNSAIYAQMNNMRHNNVSLPETREEIAFNTLFTKEKEIIERCFGQLKRRFPILQYMVRLKLDRVVSVIISCAVLDNMSKCLNELLLMNKKMT
nr:unnamed protein product [Callosobruchus analis]